MEPIIVGAIIGGSIGLIYAGYMLLSASRKKGDRYLGEMTSRVMPLDVALPPNAVMAALKGGVADHPATLEAIDEAAARIVFTDAATMTTVGFFYPVHVTATPGGAHLDIGIVSRGNQWGPLVTKAHRKFLSAIRATLGLEPDAP